MKFDLKNILIGITIGVIGTTLVFFLIGDVDIKTDFQFGEKSDQDNKNIRIDIEKKIDKNGQEIVNVNATGYGSVTIEDIEHELEKLYLQKNIDISSGDVEVQINITLDQEIDFE
jgi:hypothetical protein